MKNNIIIYHSLSITFLGNSDYKNFADFFPRALARANKTEKHQKKDFGCFDLFCLKILDFCFSKVETFNETAMNFS